MDEEIKSQIEGEFNGYNDGAIFCLTNGQVWQQKHYKYMYKYAYRPRVRLYKNNGKWFLEVQISGCEPIEVIRVSKLVDGQIVSDFNGFSQNARFQFQNGSIWEQSEYKYNYHYAYRPSAYIVDGINGIILSVDGMSETVKVRRVR